MFFLSFYFFTRQSKDERLELKCEIKARRQINAAGFKNLAFLDFITFVGRSTHCFINDSRDVKLERNIATRKNLLFRLFLFDSKSLVDLHLYTETNWSSCVFLVSFNELF